MHRYYQVNLHSSTFPKLVIKDPKEDPLLGVTHEELPSRCLDVMRRVSPVRPARARGGYKAAREGCRGPRGLCATASGRVKCGCGARARVCDCARAAARPRVGGRCDRRPRIGRAAPVKGAARAARNPRVRGDIARARARGAVARQWLGMAKHVFAWPNAAALG